MGFRSYNTLFESVSITSTTADAGANVIYTVTTTHDCELDFCMATNGSATHNISVQIYHADHATYHHVLREHSIAGNDSYRLVESDRIYLHAGDKVVAYKSGGTLDVTVSGKLYYNPVRGV